MSFIHHYTEEQLDERNIPTGPCRWCTRKQPDLVFENANLCNECYQMATTVAQTPTLCEACSGLLTDEGVIEDLLSMDGYLHSDAKYLQTSAENGCGLCRILLLQDPNPEPEHLGIVPVYLFAAKLTPSTPGGIQAESTSSYGQDIISFYFGTEPAITSLELSISAHEDDPAAKYISQRPPETYLGSDRINQQILEWLKECQNEHSESKLCNETVHTQLPRLPTRVIDVGSQFDHECKLFESPEITHERYVTLSYCWGTQRFIVTTKKNIPFRKERLGEATLPQTFRDAIATTRSLGFRYLWIDSLCIIQDSDEDKAIEIKAMGDIYSKSSLTISVVSARGTTEGFLRTSPQSSVGIPYRCPDGTIGSVQVSPQRTVDIRKAPLFTRAWCLQENLLSPRVLLYTDLDVIWQCQSIPMQHHNTANVAYIDGNHLLRSAFRRLPESILHPAETHIQVDDRAADEERYGIWTSIVQDYSRRDLSVSSDKLPALAGVAGKFEVAWSDQYFAGHWNRHFIPMLAWQQVTIVGVSRFLEFCPSAVTEYRAPSWSWASINGTIMFDYNFTVGNTRGLQAKLVSCVFDMNLELRCTAVLEASMIRAADIPDPDGSIGNLDKELMEKTWCMLLGEARNAGGVIIWTVALLLTPTDDGNFRRFGLYVSMTKKRYRLWADSKNRRTVKIV